MRFQGKVSDSPSAIILRREGIEVSDRIDHGEDPSAKLDRLEREAQSFGAEPDRACHIAEHFAAEDTALFIHDHLLRAAERRAASEARGDKAVVRFHAEALPPSVRWAVGCLRRMGLSTPEIAAIVMRVSAGHVSTLPTGWQGVAPNELSFGPTGPDGLCEPFRRPPTHSRRSGIGARGFRLKPAVLPRQGGASDETA